MALDWTSWWGWSWCTLNRQPVSSWPHLTSPKQRTAHTNIVSHTIDRRVMIKHTLLGKSARPLLLFTQSTLLFWELLISSIQTQVMGSKKLLLNIRESAITLLPLTKCLKFYDFLKAYEKTFQIMCFNPKLIFVGAIICHFSALDHGL